MLADLAVCGECHLGFRSPQPPLAELVALYESGSESAWSADAQVRQDWTLAAEWVGRLGVTSVLDIGCFDGGFLELLPDTIAKSGVEINPAAARRAAERGINIVAEDLHNLVAVAEKFDLVTAFDVIEHVHDPSEFLMTLSKVVSPRGHLVFATGNLDAPTWRFMGRRYLYSWFLEHISFVSPRWVRQHAPRLGFEVVAVERFSHTSDVRLGFMTGLLKNVAYRMSPRLIEAVRSKGSDGVPAPPPAWTSARDHILVVLRKTP